MTHNPGYKVEVLLFKIEEAPSIMTISKPLGVWLEVIGSGFLALDSCPLVFKPSDWILRPYVQGSGLPVNEVWHMVLGPGASAPSVVTIFGEALLYETILSASIFI